MLIWLMVFKILILQLQEDVERCKSTYDALNSQLLEELPKFLEIGTDVYVVAIKEFISNRRSFVGRITQELLSLMDVSNMNIDLKYLTFKYEIRKYALYSLLIFS